MIAGDNATIRRRGDATSERYRALPGTVLYGEDIDAGTDGVLLVTGSAKNAPDGQAAREIKLLDHEDFPTAGTFGDDVIAGGADNDELFGQLGDDVIQGDGSAFNGAGASRLRDGNGTIIGDLNLTASQEAIGDGDDYVEGGGGDDVIFGNLGQDDLIGGSSTHFMGLDPTEDLRPDGADIIFFGGAGLRIGRHDEVDVLDDLFAERHARDADTIVGDNGNIFRIVGTNGVDGGSFLSFSYDDDGNTTVIVRGVELVDYTPGGFDRFPGLDPLAENGAADEVHGESGDDVVYGQIGNNVLFGDAGDDDLIGGYGHDWISGGTGQDGALGDDGRIYTSRNGTAETLYGIAAIPAASLDLEISTPGNVQVATINVSATLKKTVNLTPFNLTDDALGMDDPLNDPTNADDIIFGGLGSDFLHGGAGDDAISGAEALSGADPASEGHIQLYDGAGNPTGLLRSDFARPNNPGGALNFSVEREGEFAQYDEFDPLAKILLDDGGVAKEFFLNFVADDGGTPIVHADASNDGEDVLFGDLGNDWIVGGTGRDTLWGGWGNDLLNADDVLETNGGLNDVPETDVDFEDRAFGGAGLDVLIANTGGDRLIDWVGEFNSFLVPFAPFGLFTVSRMVPPALFDFLYDLSESQGADPTRASDTGNDAARNGELGLVTQKDDAWQDQTGGPRDPQPGNIPGGPRDVLLT